MALPARDQIRIWSLVAVASGLVLWFLGDVILPFVLGAAVAYLLDPVADWLETHGLPRAAAVSLITALGVLVFLAGVLLLVPLLKTQVLGLIETVPAALRELDQWLSVKYPALMEPGSPLRGSLDQIGMQIRAKGGELLQLALSSVSNLVAILTLLVITPVVSFYLLLDWDRMVARVDLLLPRDHAPAIRRIAQEIDRTLAAFIRGQGMVCLILGSFYAIALMVVGLAYGLVVGLVAGALTFIPYIGALVGGALSIGLALFQFWGEWGMIAAVAGIFAVGQFMEGNVLTPRLVGGSVGLHPVWLLFALSVFGTLFGFVGMLVAVPVAAAIGVIVRFAIGGYLEGRLYRGLSAMTAENDQDAAP